MSNAGISRLVAAFDSHARDRAAKPDPFEFGTIQSNMAILLDRFPHPIPLGDYLVGRALKLPGVPPLAPGDRVAVAWFNGGADPMIMDVVVITGA